MPYVLKQCRTVGRVTKENRLPPFPGGICYRAERDAKWVDGLVFPIPKGARLSGARYLTFDVLLAGGRFVTSYVKLQGAGGETLRYFYPLCECQTRIVIPLSATDLANKDRVLVGVGRKTEPAARFCISPLTFTETEPSALARPVLPRGPLVDEMGQSTLHEWPGRAPDVASMVRRLQARLRAAPRQRWPASFSRWGGWKARRVKATGFFRTHHDGRRWWLVDPDGHLFWSSGMDCVHTSIDHESKIETRYLNLEKAHAALPSHLGPFGRCYRVNPWHGKEDREYNYLEANFIRAFGAERWYESWARVAHAELRRLGCNTAGDWSDEHAARRAGTPYARALELYFRFEHTPMAVGSLPDVFHPGLGKDAAVFAESLRETRDDPAMLGYFLNNEPGWHMRQAGGPAAALLFQNPSCRTREALADFLQKRHRTDTALSCAWGMATSLGEVARGLWSRELTPAACRDLEDFGTIMIERLCRTMSVACRKVDPNHLNLGVRWWTFPPLWVLKAMGCFDVISFNYYLPKPDMVGWEQEREAGVEQVALALKRPFMVGEWHFGALDGGLASAGLCRVRDQEARGRAYRNYVENAAALPWCVGVHWFNLYDRNALYSPGSSENYNIGLIDLTHGRHEPICRAARKAHTRLYAVASGQVAPYRVDVEQVHPSR